MKKSLCVIYTITSIHIIIARILHTHLPIQWRNMLHFAENMCIDLSRSLKLEGGICLREEKHTEA